MLERPSVGVSLEPFPARSLDYALLRSGNSVRSDGHRQNASESQNHHDFNMKFLGRFTG